MTELVLFGTSQCFSFIWEYSPTKGLSDLSLRTEFPKLVKLLANRTEVVKYSSAVINLIILIAICLLF